MAYIYDIADTWSGGGAFTGIKLNVTDGGSTAGSLLMDLQVGGVSRFRVEKNGQVVFGNNTGYVIDQFLNIIWGFNRISGTTLRANVLEVGNASDTILTRDAANTLAQRNSTAAQAFNLYKTYTDASNYERGFMRFVGDVLEIGAEAAGTGTARTLRFFNTATTQLNMTIDPAGATVGLTREGLNYIRATNVVSGALALGTSISGGRVDSIVVTGTAVEIREDIVLMANLPTSNPAVAGQLWNDAGTLKVSAG